jgi:hypothetical protein
MCKLLSKQQYETSVVDYQELFFTFPENRLNAILQIRGDNASMFILTHDGTRTVWLLRPGAGNQEQRSRRTTQ